MVLQLRFVFLLLLLSLPSLQLSAQPAAQGQWKNIFNTKYSLQLFDDGEEVLITTKHALIGLNKKDFSSVIHDKTDGLSDWRVRCSAFNPADKSQIIAYENSKIDILYADGRVLNIYDIFNKSLPVSKKINRIKIYQNSAYICTDFGIAVYNLTKKEFKDTYIIGPNASYTAINDIIFYDTTLYAATNIGLYEADSLSPNLADYNNWQLSSAITQKVNLLSIANHTLYAATDTSMYGYNTIAWTLQLHQPNMHLNSIRAFFDTLILTSVYSSSPGVIDSSRLLLLLSNGTLIRKPVPSFLLNDAYIDAKGDCYVADAIGVKVQKMGSPTWTDIYVASMPTNNATNMAYNDEKMWLLPTPPTPQNYTQFGLHAYDSYQWQSYIDYAQPALSNVFALHDVAHRKSDNSIFIASFRSGLVQLKNGVATLYDSTNSLIRMSDYDPAFLIGGVATDSENNIWMTNFGTPKPLVILTPNNTWFSFEPTPSFTQSRTLQIMLDYYNTAWVRTLGNTGVLVYNLNNTIADNSDDYSAQLTVSNGLPSNIITTITEDKNNEVWVGCDNGIGVFRCTNSIFDGCKAEQIRTSLGGFGSYLFENVYINDIAVDGANRKWIATSSGAYLISPDGQEQLLFFDESNSPMLSNNIVNISINEKTGEVFFMHDAGISVYRSNASSGLADQSEAYVYPNPAIMPLQAIISITHLVDNSEVKITDVAGNLVMQGNSNGGTYTWDGKDYKGNAVVSGVYYALLSEATTKQQRSISFTIIQQ